MKEILMLAKQTGLFSAIPDEVIQKDILSNGQIQEYRKGQYVIEPQQRINRFGIVISGKINIMHIFPDGNYSLMSAITTGEILGIDLVCTPKQISPYHAVAASQTRVLYYPIARIMVPGHIRESARLQILANLLALISNENMKKEYRLAILSQKGLRERIITYLSMQSARRKKTTFAISFSREELAAYLCVNRSALSHELSLMQQEGLIAFHKNYFTILTEKT